MDETHIFFLIVERVQGTFDYWFIMAIGAVFFCAYRICFSLLSLMIINHIGTSVEIEVQALTEKSKKGITGQKISRFHPVYRVTRGPLKNKVATSQYKYANISASFYQHVGDILPAVYFPSTGNIESEKGIFIRARQAIFRNIVIATGILFGINSPLKHIVNPELKKVLSLEVSWNILSTMLQFWAIFLLFECLRRIDYNAHINRIFGFKS